MQLPFYRESELSARPNGQLAQTGGEYSGLAAKKEPQKPVVKALLGA